MTKRKTEQTETSTAPGTPGTPDQRHEFTHTLVPRCDSLRRVLLGDYDAMVAEVATGAGRDEAAKLYGTTPDQLRAPTFREYRDLWSAAYVAHEAVRAHVLLAHPEDWKWFGRDSGGVTRGIPAWEDLEQIERATACARVSGMSLLGDMTSPIGYDVCLETHGLWFAAAAVCISHGAGVKVRQELEGAPQRPGESPLPGPARPSIVH